MNKKEHKEELEEIKKMSDKELIEKTGECLEKFRNLIIKLKFQ